MSNVFKDGKGEEWSLNITVNTIRRVKEALGIDLMSIVDEVDAEGNSILHKLHNDIELLINTVYMVCKPQADAKGISDVDFGELMATGDILEEATTALIEGMVLFFPPRRRSVLQAMRKKYMEMEEKAATRIESEMNNIDLDKMMEQALNQQNSGGLSPAPLQS